MTIESLATLLGVAAVVITALAALTKAIADLITANRKKDTSPAPQVGIPAPAPVTDDIDYRAYEDMKADRDLWRERAERAEADRGRIVRQYAEHIDEDTEPIPHKESP